jgi:electron transfer flavoprotein alpha subunit
MSGVLAYVEHAAGVPDRVSLEALALGRRLADGVDSALEAVVIDGAGSAVASELGAHGVSTVHLVEDHRLADFAPEAYAATIAGLATARAASVVLGPGTEPGNEVMAHVGARTGLPMAANVTAAEQVDGRWRLTRQRWAGSLLEDAWLDAPTRILTVAPHAVAMDERAGAPTPTVVAFTPDLTERDLRVRVTGREAPDSGGVSLTDARVVVGGGRGVGSAEGFAMLEELASLLGGAVGVSRAVTSAGWRPHAEQVGQTGLRIAPDLYIACGISGAIQHIVGCKAAKRILAINTDAEAPIMARADYAVIGDVHAVVPAINAEIRRVAGR